MSQHNPDRIFQPRRVAVAAIALTALILTPVANTLHFVQDFTWKHALVFGAIISATGPIAVASIFRSLGAPKRLSMLLGLTCPKQETVDEVADATVRCLLRAGPAAVPDAGGFCQHCGNGGERSVAAHDGRPELSAGAPSQTRGDISP